MALGSETISLAGSGLVFQNTYSSSVSEAYRAAIVTAENFLQAHFTGSVTAGVTFDFQPVTGGAAQSQYFSYGYTYGQVVGALTAHATTANDAAVVAALPTVDPSNGAGFGLTNPQAQSLGLATPSGRPDDATITLSSTEHWDFGQDMVGSLEYELTQSVFGRLQSLGLDQSRFTIFDLFRFAPDGQRDYTGGRDGVTTVFGLSPTLLSGYEFHNSLNTSGVSDGYGFGDWDNTITGGSGADNFHGSQDAGIDKVMDFRAGEGDRVQLDPGTTYTVSQVGADTVLDMGAGNQMILVGVQMSSLLPNSIFLG